MVAGADLRLRCETARVYVLASPHFYSASACAFTTTERALANQARRLFTIIDSMLLPVVCHVSCGLRQRHYRIIRCTIEGFTKATCPLLPTNENTVFEQTLRARTTINHNAIIGRCRLRVRRLSTANYFYFFKLRFHSFWSPSFQKVENSRINQFIS